MERTRRTEAFIMSEIRKGKLYCQKCGTLCEEYLDVDIKREMCPHCGYIYYRNPFPCISVLVVDKESRIVLGKRSKDSIYPDRWCMPCGYIEYDETYLEAAVREVKEEVGIDIVPLRIINVVSNHFDNGVHSLVPVILAEAKTTTILPGDDIVEARWFALNVPLPELAFEADQYIINEFKWVRENNRIMNGIELRDGVKFADIK